MKLKLALIFVLAAIGFHLYLTQHYYGLSFGTLTADSVCNLSTKFNCDTVSASRFASVFGIPIALWGAVTNLILFVLLLGWWLGWSENLGRLSRYAFLLSGFIAATSIVMGSVSTFFIGTYCLFCMFTYGFSFITFELIRREQKSIGSKSSSAYLLELFGPAKKYLLYLAMIPLLTFFFHRTYLMRYGGQQMNSMVNSSLADWQSGTTVNFTATASLTKGPADAKMVMHEFADFRCGHCKNAATSIKAFVNAHPDIQLKFYSFPLDGSCNEAIPGGDGQSCYLAKSVLCAEKVGRGWDMHDHIFDKQDDINRASNLEFAKKTVEEALSLWELNIEEHNACLQNPEIDAAIRAQAKQGVDAGVKGTPSFYVNGKRLARGQLLPVLNAVHDHIYKKGM